MICTPRRDDIPLLSQWIKKYQQILFLLIFFGAEGGTRTRTWLPTRDFKSLASAIPPLRRIVKFGGTTQTRTGDKGFADPSLTTWRWCHVWSGRRDSDPRYLPWQGSALPLSHSRIRVDKIYHIFMSLARVF